MCTKVDCRNDEDEFKLIGLNAFFDTKNDKDVKWDEFFNLSEDEIYYALNMDQIIEEDKNEDKIWEKYL